MAFRHSNDRPELAGKRPTAIDGGSRNFRENDVWAAQPERCPRLETTGHALVNFRENGHFRESHSRTRLGNFLRLHFTKIVIPGFTLGDLPSGPVSPPP